MASNINYAFPDQDSKLLFEHGYRGNADKVAKILRDDPTLNRVFWDGMTILTLACRHRFSESVICELLRYGFNPLQKEYFSGFTPLQFAVEPNANYSDRLILKMLGCARADEVRQNSLHIKNNFGRKPLHKWKSKELKNLIERSCNFKDYALRELYKDKFLTSKELREGMSDEDDSILIVQAPSTVLKRKVLSASSSTSSAIGSAHVVTARIVKKRERDEEVLAASTTLIEEDSSKSSDEKIKSVTSSIVRRGPSRRAKNSK